MARLGGMSTESFSSARERFSSARSGLGSILRDQKTPAGANRVHVLLGLSSQSPAAAGTSRSLHSFSPIIESNCFLNLDGTETKDEDVWGLDISEGGTFRPLDPIHRHRLLHANELSSTYSPQTNCFSSHGNDTHSLKNGSGLIPMDAPKEQPNSTFVEDNMHSTIQLAMDKLTVVPPYCSDSTSANIGSSRLSNLRPSEPRRVAHKGLISSRSIPGANKLVDRNHDLETEHQSAPLNVPNLSKILQKGTADDSIYSEEVGDEDDEERIPPHIILAREYAQNERMTSSVCEGQGRTLKGRDMRRVRNAVWQQIGFAD